MGNIGEQMESILGNHKKVNFMWDNDAKSDTEKSISSDDEESEDKKKKKKKNKSGWNWRE